MTVGMLDCLPLCLIEFHPLKVAGGCDRSRAGESLHAPVIFDAEMLREAERESRLTQNNDSLRVPCPSPAAAKRLA